MESRRIYALCFVLPFLCATFIIVEGSACVLRRLTIDLTFPAFRLVRLFRHQAFGTDGPLTHSLLSRFAHITMILTHSLLPGGSSCWGGCMPARTAPSRFTAAPGRPNQPPHFHSLDCRSTHNLGPTNTPPPRLLAIPPPPPLTARFLPLAAHGSLPPPRPPRSAAAAHSTQAAPHLIITERPP